MDHYMDDNRHMARREIEELKRDFLHSLTVVEACFGDHAFQRWVPERTQWRQQVLASLYDAEMFACRGYSPEDAHSKQEMILSGLKELFSNSEFRQAIDAQTNTPIYFRRRVEMVKNMLEGILGPVKWYYG